MKSWAGWGYELKIELNYLLFWRKRNFHIACPNAMGNKAIALLGA